MGLCGVFQAALQVSNREPISYSCFFDICNFKDSVESAEVAAGLLYDPQGRRIHRVGGRSGHLEMAIPHWRQGHLRQD